MKFQKGRAYRHINCLDIDIHVVKPPRIGKNSVYLHVRYFNRYWKFYQGEAQKVRIKQEDFHKWYEVTYVR